MVKINYDISEKIEFLDTIEAFLEILQEFKSKQSNLQNILVNNMKDILDTKTLNENNSILLIGMISRTIENAESYNAKNRLLILNTYYYPIEKVLMEYLEWLTENNPCLDGEVA